MTNIQPHRHKGLDSPQIDISDLIGPAIIRADIKTSAQQDVPTLIQISSYSLGAGSTVFVTLPQVYSNLSNLQIFVTSDNSSGYHYLQGIVTSGFTVSGQSTTDTGHYLAIGYK